MLREGSLRAVIVFAFLALFVGTSRVAQAQNVGFQVGRYEPTPAGEWSFLVDHPWYSSTRYFAGGFTLDYAHNPLVLGRRSADGSFSQIDPILSTQLYGHFDFAGSFLDRVNVALSVPVLLFEGGQPLGGVTPSAGGSVGDPRLSVMVQIYGQPDRNVFSVNLGAAVWIPLRRFTDALPPQESDQTARFLPKLVTGGLWRFLRWSFTFGFLYRAESVLGQTQPVGSEIQFGFAGSYADLMRRFAVGPELLLSTIVTNGNAFSRDFTSLELLLGGHYNIAGQVQLGAAVGLGLLRSPGTPDVRLLFRAAYAPIRNKKPVGEGDRDGDGTKDADDACPNVPGPQSPDAKLNGCPLLGDLDGDGVQDTEDVCPRIPRGDTPDPNRPGCPSGDKDGDGIADAVDRCPDTPVGDQPDPARIGCPFGDSDGDGVTDREDLCPTTPKGERPDPLRAGCPLADRDGDGIIDSDDQCPTVPSGPNPDRKRLGCPIGGGEATTSGQGTGSGEGSSGAQTMARLLTVMKPIFFKHRRATIEKRSLPVLEAVAAVLKSEPAVKRLLVRGHTDSEGNDAYNQSLSQERAQAVQTWLTEHGIAADRLEVKAYGPALPYRNNTSERGRALNRRVDFRVSDPLISEADSVAAEDKSGLEPDEDDDDGEPRGRKRRTNKKRKRTLDDMLDDVEQGRNVH